MEIIRDTRIQEKYRRGYGRDETFDYEWNKKHVKYEDPDTIIIHGTGGCSTSEDVIKWMLDGGKMPKGKNRKKQYKKAIGFFHYIIDREGKIICLIDPKEWVFHSSSFTNDRFTIGVELVNPHPDNADSYTEEQYKSLFYLMFDVLYKDFPIGTIASHKRYGMKFSGRTKNCPGNLEWEKLEAEMVKRGLSYDHDDRYESYWYIGGRNGSKG